MTTSGLPRWPKRPGGRVLARVVKTMLIMLVAVMVLLMFIGYVLDVGDYVDGGYFDDASVGDAAIVGVLLFAVIGGLALLATAIGLLRDRHIRRHRKHWGAHDGRRPSTGGDPADTHGP